MLFLILAPIIGAITLLFLFIFERRFDLLEKETEQAELEKELQQAKYQQLNEQIKPHFLFNTLNVILSLARLQRKDELIRALEVFSLFLKFNYKTKDTLITLFEEIRYTEYYIEIQKLRFGARLTVQIDYEEDLAESLIPPFILQTLVENAFKHAFEVTDDLAILTIEITKPDDLIIMEVSDNGIQQHNESSQDYSGYGLENIHRRLSICFGDASSVEIKSTINQGTTVQVKWPKTTKTDMKEVIK
ncbi:sensor histidine kinase [Aquibacillus albus]|uniref:Sensor histidine kinase YesM n=1 Tax=Aquibacillus albus TaxID=1168171 RepID=A0ABS2MVY1_9BACI|nr:histidine kinase [Aquibacillus albus]MBM7570050.1 sensor histidine kinase YesM [Aquibacillus albus]